MRWPVLGISVLFCLQLWFTAYIVIDRQSNGLLAANEDTSDMRPTANTAYINDDTAYLDQDAYQDPDAISSEKIAVSSPYRRKTIRPAEAILVSSKKVAKSPAARIVNAMPQYVAMEKPFESITIEYPRTALAMAESENYQPVPRAILQAEKRSFISKSVSVLKKPYDWIKALGSRLN